MKRFLLFLPLLFFIWSSFAQNNKYKIEVNITHISSDKSQMIVKLYDSEEDFLKVESKVLLAKIEKGQSSVIFPNITEGTYAIAVIHDENENNKIDFNFLGIPSESLAASNNAKAFIVGPPKYKDAKFIVKGKSIRQHIKM